MRFELPCSVSDLSSLFSQFPRRFSYIPRYLQKHILKERLFSIQVPPLRSIARKEIPDFVGAVNRMVDFGLVTEFSIEPDLSWEEDWEELLELLHPRTCLSISNVGLIGSSLEGLEATSKLLRRFPSLMCAFDLNRWITSGGDTGSQELYDFLTTFAHRIRRVQLSVPSSKASFYQGRPKDRKPHLLTESGYKVSARFYEATAHVAYFHKLGH